MDKFDKAILETLQRDATLSVAEIADRISLSKTACWRRIQKLESEGVVKSRVALLDQEKLNLSLSVFISVRTNQHNQEWLQEFRRVVSGIAEVLEVYRMSGELDYLVRAVVTDMAGFDNLYQELIKADLFDVSSSFVMETIKHTTELPLNHL
ncbi:Lrp/AsnC family transcriptional regulator [Porticoccus sp. W117]|uniref:Lrp/AsnC family transcriptional regulator n=1 Tax=Porticoccus sp. W117 TaxID=3054777 RepID=UPI002591EA82|nr:Lrp/AsnC family transcriptional regulator [Porticoccus sp. W117]MDM3870693.1 Lrp/AsnC family transcriptional regulator [Porticoccus sp. W117]